MSNRTEILEAENRKLQNRLEAKDAYIKALEEQCKIAHDLIKAYKHGEVFKANESLKNALETVTP